MTTRPSVYVAGPGGFDAAGRAWHVRVRQLLDEAGFDVLDPWLASEEHFRVALAVPEGPPRLEALRTANRAAGAANAAMIREADGVLALLDGVDIDSGTAAEIGYACALETPVVGYRTDWRTTGDNEAATVNLQVEYFVDASGGTIVVGGPATDDETLLRDAIGELRVRLDG